MKNKILELVKRVKEGEIVTIVFKDEIKNTENDFNPGMITDCIKVISEANSDERCDDDDYWNIETDLSRWAEFNIPLEKPTYYNTLGIPCKWSDSRFYPHSSLKYNLYISESDGDTFDFYEGISEKKMKLDITASKKKMNLDITASKGEYGWTAICTDSLVISDTLQGYSRSSEQEAKDDLRDQILSLLSEFDHLRSLGKL
jgi:hypothetical protein